MSKETQDLLEADILEYTKEDIEGALMLITGMFVGINVAYCEIRGNEGDGEKEINISGASGQREITIHAVKDGSNE